MKKTLIASAVAAAFSSTAFAMDPATDLAEMLESMPEFYGNLQLYYLNTDTDNGTTEVGTNDFQDGGSTFGLKHDHAITDDLTGFLKLEFEFDGDENNAGIDQSDEIYMGIKGSFGSVQVGNDDTVYEWIDIVDNSEQVGIAGELADDDEQENIQYYSPEIAEMIQFGVTLPTESDDEFGGAIAATASLEVVDLGIAYSIGRGEEGVDGGSAIGFSASTSLDALTLNFQYESRDADESSATGNATGGEDAGQDTTFIALQGIYSMGATTLRLGYSMQDWDEDTAAGYREREQSVIELAAHHSLSDNMYVFLEYATGTTELTPVGGGSSTDTDVDALAIGAAYSF